MRKLASIQKIIDLQPIPNADKIMKATVLGWELVVKKEEFKVGDLCVYIEIDSQLPSDNPSFEFMANRKYRVKTIKLRGQISQGLALPISILPNGNWQEGDDVTDTLKITKYDIQAQQEKELQQVQNKNWFDRNFGQYKWYRQLFMKNRIGKQKYNFPTFIKKTDETRIQNIPSILEKEKDTPFIVTEKLDGCSATFFLQKNTNRKWLDKLFNRNEYIFGVCSRNLWLYNKDSSHYWKIAEQFKIKEVLKQLIRDKDLIVLQGEILGEGIQGNKYKIKGLDFYAFNLIFDNDKVDSISASSILKEYNIKFVPILKTNFRLLNSVSEMVDYSMGNSQLLSVMREGLVIRNNDKNISFKVINPKFLLKNNE